MIDSSKDKEWEKQMEVMTEIYEKEIKLHTIAIFKDKEYELEDLLNNLLNKLEQKEKQLEAYENMKKELIKELNFYETTEWGIRGYEILEKIRNILNIVGDSNE